MASFTLKQIEVRITLAAGSFGGKGTEKVFNGLPVTVEVKKTGGDEKPSCDISIGGMAYSDMEQLTTLAFRPLQTRKNLVAVFAGDTESGLSQVFAGEITTASANFNEAPEVKFNIEAISGYYPSLKPAGPQTITGSAPVADIISQQAKEMGYEFRNEGVTTKLTNTILNGTPMQKARAAANQAGATLLIDDMTLVLLPPGKERKGTTVLLSDQSGLMGYPSFSSDGIELDALYNPAFQIGGLVEVKSIVPKASGLWRVTKLEHKLSANDPNADDWTSSIEAVYVSEKTASTPQGTV
jgi:hypothetical protein